MTDLITLAMVYRLSSFWNLKGIQKITVRVVIKYSRNVAAVIRSLLLSAK